MSHRLLGPLTDFRFFCPQCASRRIAENSLASKIHFNINVWSAEPASADRMIANVEFPNVDKGFLLFHGSTNFRESTSCQQTSAPKVPTSVPCSGGASRISASEHHRKLLFARSHNFRPRIKSCLHALISRTRNVLHNEIDYRIVTNVTVISLTREQHEVSIIGEFV